MGGIFVDSSHGLSVEPERRLGRRVASTSSSSRLGYARRSTARKDSTMKKLFEMICCILHPVAVVLIWIYLLMGRGEMGLIARLTWGITSIIPLVPFIYVLTGNDFI